MIAVHGMESLVSCDMVTGDVIGLDLSCSWLSSSIPSNTSFSLLSCLQKLNLAFNEFYKSHIPSDFVRFPSLTHLNLSSSDFSGQVPFQISHLSKWCPENSCTLPNTSCTNSRVSEPKSNVKRDHFKLTQLAS